jgi:hypothetical protein
MKRCEYLAPLDANYNSYRCQLQTQTIFIDSFNNLHYFCVIHALICNMDYKLLTPEEFLCCEVM